MLEVASGRDQEAKGVRIGPLGWAMIAATAVGLGSGSPATAGRGGPPSLDACVGHAPFDPVAGVAFLDHPAVRAAVRRAVAAPKVRKWLLVAGTSPSPPIFRKDRCSYRTGAGSARRLVDRTGVHRRGGRLFGGLGVDRLPLPCRTRCTGTAARQAVSGMVPGSMCRRQDELRHAVGRS